MATDVAGRWIYLWATGTATDIAGGAEVLDVGFQQTSYATFSGNGTFNDMIIGGCAGGWGVNSGAAAIAEVNNNPPLSGLVGNCSVSNPFVSVGLPLLQGIGNATTLSAAAQFVFTAGSAAGSKIVLPWGDDFPDPSVTGDPNSAGFIDPSDTTDINSLGLTDLETPEPATLSLLGAALIGLACLRRRKQGH